MDLALAIAVIVAIIIGAIVLQRSMRRRRPASESRHGHRVEAARLDRILAELGETLVIAAPETAARELVDEVVLQQPRFFQPLGDGSYGIRFVEPDDARVVIASTPDGARLHLVAFREYLGMPKGAEHWKDLRAAVASAAHASGMTTTAGPHLSYARTGVTEWALSTE